MEMDGMMMSLDGLSADPFHAIRHTRNTKLENQQKAISLLDAVEGTLRERQLEASPENYFRALWPLLEKAPAMTSTIVYLASFVMPSLLLSFIEDNYSELYAPLPALLRDHINDGPLMRALLGCLRKVFEAFPGAEAWAAKDSLQELFSAVLALCVEERPKVRKCAQDCVSGTLLAKQHAGLGMAVQVCKVVLQGSTRKESSRALHLAPLLRRLVPALDQAAIDGLIGPTLQACGLGNTHLTVSLLGFLEALLQETCEETGEALPRCVQLNQTQVKKILDGLTRLTPGTWELAELCAAWATAISAALAHSSLARLEKEALLKTLLSALASSHESVRQAVQLGMSRLSCPPGLLHASLQQDEDTERLPYLLAIIRDQAMLRSAERTRCLLDEPGQALILAVANLYDRKGLAGLRGDITKAIGDYVKVYGSPAVLEVLPVGLEGGCTSRAWLLPLLKEAVQNDSLAYFNRNFVPLADRLKAKAEGLRAAGKLGDAKVYDTLLFQIWSLVPAYLRYPGDLVEAFPLLAPRLAQLITEDPLLRPTLVNALTSLIQRCKQYEDDLEADGIAGSLPCPPSLETNAAELAMLSSLLPNLLPVVFNLLGVTAAAEQRVYILQCIKSLLDLADPALVTEYFTRVSSHASSGPQAAAMLEVLCTMAPFVEDGQAAFEHLLQTAMGALQTEDSAMQKAAYKALNLVLSHEIYGPQLLSVHLDALESVIMPAGELVEVGAVRKCRFRLLLTLLPMMPDSHLHWVPLLLPEVVLGTKEVNQKARLLAFELLLAFARRMSRGGIISAARAALPGEDRAGSLEEYMSMLLAGLAGRTPHMISATLLALARVLFELATSLPPSVIQPLLSDVLLLFGSPSREIVKAAFGFVKVAVLCLDPAVLQPFLPSLLGSILQWSGEHSMHFKVRVRHLLERLVRRFGFEDVAACIPEEHRKLIVNIRKRRERLKRRKQEQQVGEEEEHEDDVDLDAITQAALSRQTSLVSRRTAGKEHEAIRPSARFEAALYDSESDLEDDDDGEGVEEPVQHEGEDDLETALSRRLSMRSRATVRTAKTAKKAVAKKPIAKNEDFKMNPEGKMIIREEDDSDAPIDEDDEGIVVDESAHNLYEESLNTFQRPGKHVKFSQKKETTKSSKRRTDADSDDGEDTTAQGGVEYDACSRISRLSRVTAMSKRAKPAPGDEFRAKGRGAKGDAAKKGGRFEPYAYVPLQRASGKNGGKEATKRYFQKRK